jgi:uncharacterized protein (DUF1810 family)
MIPARCLISVTCELKVSRRGQIVVTTSAIYGSANERVAFTWKTLEIRHSTFSSRDVSKRPCGTDRSAVDIFGYSDWLKFRSSMTLFDVLNPGTSPFSRALDKYFDGEPDRRTLSLLECA